MRLIDAHKLQKAIYEHKAVRSITKDKVVEMIKEQPTINPVKHGQWIDKYGDGDWHCSCCGAIVENHEQDYRNWYFCYHCGAKMDEVSE